MQLTDRNIFYPIAALFILMAGAHNVAAQQKYTEVISNASVDSLIEKNIIENKLNDGIQGYRIQIFSHSDRKGAIEARTKFLQLFPDVEAYLIYQQPNFRVRVGDYRNKLEAHAMYKKMLSEFQQVIIVPDKIKLPKL